MHSESAGVAQSSLEAARVAAMRGSDATSAIDVCLRVMDAPQLEATMPALLHLLSRGTGLPTRAGTARFLVQLGQQQPLLLVPHAARLLRTLHSNTIQERSPSPLPTPTHPLSVSYSPHLKPPQERSEVARSAYAAAAAQVTRGAPVDVLAGVVSELVEKYTSDDGGVDDAVRFAVGRLV